MNNAAREKILKSWSGVNDVALIKEVATKGEFVELCVEHLARRKKISLDESKEFFQQTVDAYVSRLLNEKLVCKAENVLKNLRRDVKSVYYQFAFDTADPFVKDVILDHLKKRDPFVYDEDRKEYEFYWQVLNEMAAENKLNLETFLSKDDKFRSLALLKFYFSSENHLVLDKIDPSYVWEYFILTADAVELIKWLRKDRKAMHGKYLHWKITPEMCKFAVSNLQNPCEQIKNILAGRGYFFPDEKDNTRLVLRRIFTSQSYESNKNIINNLTLVENICENEMYLLLLQEFASEESLEKLHNLDIPSFIIQLKKADLNSAKDFLELSQLLRGYLKNETNSEFVLLFETFLDRNSSINSLKDLNSLAYIKSFNQRNDSKIPTAYELLKKFKQLDLVEISRESDKDELLTFKNLRLAEKYSKKFKLTYIDYIRQCRGSYAAYYFFREQLEGYSQISKSQLYNSCEIVTELAIQNYNNSDLVAHCVAFCETLGFDTQNLRSFVKLIKLAKDESAEQLSFQQLSEKAEEKLLLDYTSSSNKVFPLQEYHGLVRISNCCSTKKWPECFLSDFASKNDWWKILVLMQYFEIPLMEIKCVLQKFSSPQMCQHFLHALSNEPVPDKPKRRASVSRQKSRTKSDNSQTTNTSAETMTSSISSNDPNPLFKSSNQIKFFQDVDDLDIFAIILLSTTTLPEEKLSNFQKFLEILKDPHSYSTSFNLMKNSVKFVRPVLAVLSAMVCNLNVDWNWIVWLAVSTKSFKIVIESTKKVNEVSWRLIEHCIRNGYVSTLNRSFRIFYEDHPFGHLAEFIQRTGDLHFDDENISHLRSFLVCWSNGEVIIPGSTHSKDTIIKFAIKSIVLHLTHNFTSTYHQKQYLEAICKSGISDISLQIDCCFLKSVFEITSRLENLAFDFEKLVERDPSECEKLMGYLIDTKRFDDGIKLASLLNLPICDIVYMKWTCNVDINNLNFDSYEQEIEDHILPPEILINFLLFTASQLEEACKQKYIMLKKALDVIKKNHLFPNESFDRDQIEYDMILCYLQIDDVSGLEIYHSEYFEEIMTKERCVLYKSFLELKELAGIDELTTSLKPPLLEGMKIRFGDLLNTLLDKGDIVEALRLQAMFESRPIDLHFVVFCMALAEGLTTIYNMSKEERTIFKDVEKLPFAKFNKRTLGVRMAHGQQQSPMKHSENSDSGSAHEFEEIPSKEKKETLDAIQGIASRLKFGVNLGKRIVMAYRAAMYLDKEYLDVLRTKDNMILLRSAAYEDCLQKLLVISDILTSTHMSPIEIADYLSYEIAIAIIRPRFYIFSLDNHMENSLHPKATRLWGYDLDREFHLILELCPDTTALGKCLISYSVALKAYRKFQDNKPYEQTSTLENLQKIIKEYGLPNQIPGMTQVMSHKKQNFITVEFLIKAHQCFVHECSMEGIANVLNRAKSLNNILTNAKSWALIVRMLTGIGRYREMFYCFDSLIKNDQFESLLGQFDEEKTAGLRQAIISYIREYCPQNQELLKLAALHFLMYKELAEIWEQDATNTISTILEIAKVQELETNIPVTRIKSSSVVLTLLNQTLDSLTHATENYLLDNTLILAQKSAFNAEMVAVQIDLVSKSMSSNPPNCVFLLNIKKREEFREIINVELRFPQALILSRAYSFDINWSEAIFFQFIVNGRKEYFLDFVSQMTLTDVIVENVVKCYQLHAQSNPITPKMDECLALLIDHIQSVTLKYKLASLLSFKRIITSLINEQSYYLKDTNYGKNETDLPDV